ncbi:hypothetical protein BKA57DRAFT_532399 [Linnemannia elongata]|nr:hypothetical protein BKA57DRAFT_532399 [Linnemannia elongata]
MVAAATKLPSLKTSITQAGPPDSSTFAASPVEWWFPPADNTTPPLTTRIGDLFLLTANENNKYRVSNKPELPSKLRQEQDSLVSQLVQSKTRNMSQAYLTVIQDPPAGLVGDQIQQRVQSIVLYGEGKSTVTFGSATTKQLRHFLSSPPSTASAPPPTESTSRSEEGSVTQWRKFWRTKIPHRARTIWWRYKRDILPCGTLRAHRWNQDPKCEMRGCREQRTDKNHYIFQCSAKYLAWQSVLKEYTDKPLWSDEDLHSLLSFKPPKFSIKPEYNISAPQLLACSARNMVNNPSYQPHPHGATGKTNDAQPIRKRDVIRGILGFSKSKNKEVDATAPNQAVSAQNPPQVVGPPTASSASDIHSVADHPVISSPLLDKPLPAPVEAKRTSNIFFENLPAPVMKTELPAVQDRIEVTQQLVHCTALLLRGSPPPLSTAAQLEKQASDPAISLQNTLNLDKKELDWLAEMDKNPPAKERIHWLGTRMVDEFAKDVLKDSTEIAEIVLLGPVLNNETYRSLLSCTISALEQSVLLNVDLLQGLVQLVQVAPPESLVSDDLVKILRVLRVCLQDTHKQSSVHPFHLTLALSRLLDVMAEHKVKDLNRVEDHEPLSGILLGLKDSSDPYLMYQACYAFQALQYVPDDESALQSVLRHGTGVVNGLVQVSGIFKLDLGAVLEGLGNLQEAIGGIIEVASDVYEGVNSVIESGRGVLSSLREERSAGKKRPWYAAIRVAQALVKAGQLKDLNQLIYEAPCRGDPLFQWGICQLLGEIAFDVIWDANVRQQAVDLLGELYTNDP